MKRFYAYLILGVVLCTPVIAQFPTDAFWSDTDGIHFFNSETGQSELRFPSNPNLSGMVVPDKANELLYYVSVDKTELHVIDYDGGNDKRLFKKSERPELAGENYTIESIAVDPRFPAVYFVLNVQYTDVVRSDYPDFVYSYDLELDRLTLLWETSYYEEEETYGRIPDIAIDLAQDKIVYLLAHNKILPGCSIDNTCEESQRTSIMTRDLDGTTAETVLEGLRQARQIELHQESNSLFISGGGRTSIEPIMYKVGIDGSNLDVLFESTYLSTRTFFMDDFSERLYFYDLESQITSCNLSGEDFQKETFPQNKLPSALDLSNNEAFYVDDISYLTAADMTTPNSYNYRELIRPLYEVFELQVDQIHERIFYRSSSFYSSAVISMDYDGGNIESHNLFGGYVRGWEWVLDASNNQIITLEEDETPGTDKTAIYYRSLDDLGRDIITDYGGSAIYQMVWDVAQDRGFGIDDDIAGGGDEAIYDFKNDMAYFLVDGTTIYKSDNIESRGEDFIFVDVIAGKYLFKDAISEKIYWSNTNTSATRGLYQASYDGTGIEKIMDEPVFQVAFLYENQAPTIVSTFDDVTLDEDSESIEIEDVSGYFEDPEGSALTISIFSDTSGISTVLEDNILILDLEDNYNGTSTITVSASDGINQIRTDFTVSVSAINDEPVFELSSNEVSLEANFSPSETIEVTPAPIPHDEQDQAVSYSLSPSSVEFAEISIDEATGLITISSLLDLSGTQDFTVISNDGQAENNIYEANFNLTVAPVPVTLGSDKAISLVYPNPVRDYLFISTKRSIKQITMTDASGRLVMSLDDYNEPDPISLTSLDEGLYFINIRTSDELIRQKFIKQH